MGRRNNGQKSEVNIRKLVTFLANISFVGFLISVGIFSLSGQPADRDMVMYVAAALSAIAGTCNGYYFGYNNGKQIQDNNGYIPNDK